MRRKLTDTEIVEFIRCRESCSYTIQTYGWTRHTTRGSIRWDKPYPYQILLWDTLQAGLNVIVNKTRQIGCSWAIAAYAVWLMIFRPDTEILFLSETEKKAIRILGFAKYIFGRLPAYLKPEVTQMSQTRFEVTFTSIVDGQRVLSKSSIDSLTTTKRSGASYSPKFALMDEAAHLQNGEAVFGALAPATAHGGQLAAVSTPNGLDNFFHRIWYEANHIKGYKFVPILAHWKGCWLTEEWFAEATAGMTVQQILQEYECKFLPSGSPFFDLEQLKAIYKPPDEFPILKDTTGARIDRRTKVTFTGLDPAGGRRLKQGGKPDYTSIVSLNEYGVEIDSWHSQDTPLEDVAGYISTLTNGQKVFVEGLVTTWHRKYPGTMIIERWGPGETVFANHYMNAPDDDFSHVVGRRTVGGANSTASKIRMLNALRLAIAGRQLIIRDPFTYYCLQTFTDKGGGKYEANDGAYDDPVIALALAYSELQRQGGLLLELDDEYLGGKRMVGIKQKEDLPIDELHDILPVGRIVDGPMFDDTAGGHWRETDEFKVREARLR